MKILETIDLLKDDYLYDDILFFKFKPFNELLA